MADQGRWWLAGETIPKGMTMSEMSLTLAALCNGLAEAVAKDEDPEVGGFDLSAGLFGPNVSAWLREVDARLSAPAPGTIDPFADVRGKRMSELGEEQTDRAKELWLREQIGPSETYWHPHLRTLFRVIDRLRADAARNGATA